jgi:hypothetical protein
MGTYKDGEAFEYYTNSLFPLSDFEPLHRTPDYRSYKKGNPLYRKPDFKFRDKKTGKCFYVESKFRGGLYKGKLNWCKSDDQLQRYQEYENDAKVFILIGLGGEPASPEEVFLIPLSEIEYKGLYESIFEEYARRPNQRVKSRDLWKGR